LIYNNKENNKMSDKKILFLDVDGTLIDYETKLPSSAKKAVDLARSNGHKVYLCTGCSKAELAMRELPETDGLIGGNGAYVEDRGEVVMHQKLTKEEVKHIVDWCNARHLGITVECNSGMYCNDYTVEQGPEVMRKYAKGKGKSEEEAKKSADEYVNGFTLLHGEDLYRDDVNKIDFILSSYQDHLDSKKEFPELEANTWGGKDEQALYGDLGPSGITKKHSVDVLLKHLNADREDTIAFGDAKIDIPMFKACGYSVAMGSGGEECKEAADYVTTGVDEDGMWNAFKYLKLI
jgi:Cof subfamily protein (haloacid dehalogenase superfamily)